MIIRDVCPQCRSSQYKKNGHIHNGKQNHQCKDCGRQFVDCLEQYFVSDETRGLVERLLLERLSLRGICRTVGVGLKWLLEFIVNRFEALPDHLHVQPISCTQEVMSQRLEVEADEMASFVQKKANKQWIWLAMDAKTRQIIAFSVGDRSRKSFKKLWAMIPKAYRQHATFYTDQYGVYKGVIPAAQHYLVMRGASPWQQGTPYANEMTRVKFSQPERVLQEQYFPGFQFTDFDITKVTRLRQQRFILDLYNYRSCDAQERQQLETKARQAATESAKIWGEWRKQ